MSYNEYQYTNFKVSNLLFSPSDTVKIQFEVKNLGEFHSGEICQLYIWDKIASVARPVKELKDFKKVFLKPGENKVVNMNLTIDDFKY